jgi:hypothetical protein
MGVKDILFGKKKYFETANLGIFETRARSGSTAKNKIWLSTIRIENYSDEIVILLDGDSFGPLKDQLDVADWVVKNLKTIDKILLTRLTRSLI